jgi:hypothetical protein
MNSKKFCGLDIFQNCFLVFCCHIFFQANHNNNKKSLHYSPIMTKTTLSATTSQVTPVKKATPGKSLIKNKLSRIGEEPRTPSNQSSPVSVSTATTTQSMLSSQSTMTTSSTQSNSSNLVRALDFANLPDHTKKEPYLIDFCNPVDVKSKCLKYLSDARDLPLGQESQLTFLLNNLKLKDCPKPLINVLYIHTFGTPDQGQTLDV